METPTVELLPLLHKARGVVVERLDEFGIVGCMRFNMLHPPFDNVKLRRALLPAINQADFMNAGMGGDPELTRIGVGVFTPGSPLANTAGLETLTGPRDLALAKKLVADSGYNGEKIVFIAPTTTRCSMRKVSSALICLASSALTSICRAWTGEPWSSGATTRIQSTRVAGAPSVPAGKA